MSPPHVPSTASTSTAARHQSASSATAAATTSSASFAPSGEVVDVWGARRILDALERGESRKSICHWARISNSTLRRIIRHRSAYGGAAREPAQGQGKRDDPRWHYAGSRGRTNLAELEIIRTTHGDKELLRETQRRVLASTYMVSEPAFSTTAEALHDRLNFTSKVITGRAAERDPVACDAWFRWFHAKYHADQIVCVDETSNDDRVANRTHGISKRGQRARDDQRFHRGQRYSAMSAFTVMDGFIDPFITKETFDGRRWLAGIRRNVLPYMGAYPGPRSVLLVDNARIHGMHAELFSMLAEIGARVEFLEPYDPEHMPIEFAFRAYKLDRKSNPARYAYKLHERA